MYITQDAEFLFEKLFNTLNKQIGEVTIEAKSQVSELVGGIIGSTLSLKGTVENEESLNGPFKVAKEFIDELNEIYILNVDLAFECAKRKLKVRHSNFFKGFFPHYSIELNHDFRVRVTFMSEDEYVRFVEEFSRLMLACGLTILTHHGEDEGQPETPKQQEPSREPAPTPRQTEQPQQTEEDKPSQEETPSRGE